jgi:protein-tyrosine phosphatase
MYWLSQLGPTRLAISARPQGGDSLDGEIRSFRSSGIDVLVSVITSEEITEFDLRKEPDYCRQHGIRFEWLPISDHDTPDSFRAVRGLAERLSKDLVARRGVLIHCQAGIGRSSLLAACTLCMMGVSVYRAFDLIARARGCNVPETELQRTWVERFAERVRPARSA